MSLKILQPGIQPLGQFDAVDAEVTTFLGGEICSLTYVVTSGQPGVSGTGNDQAAYDQFDGYVTTAGPVFKRPAVSKNFNTTVLTNASRPLFLADDGITGYGTLFGTVVGGTVGQASYGPSSTIPSGSKLGPHTALASGKITLWDKPGLYAVSLDAVDTEANGLVPTNAALTGGDALFITAGGLLCPTGATGKLSGSPQVGHFVEFNTNGSLVTTPNYLVAALNSPSGNVSSVQAKAFQYATIYFSPAA